MSARRILYVVSHWPGAPPYGAQQRVLHIGRLLQKVGDVTLVLVGADEEAERWRGRTETEFTIARVIKAIPVSSGGIAGRLRHEFDAAYLQTVPFAVAAADRQFVLDLLPHHDMTWVHTIKTADLLRIDHWPHTVIDIDDIPSRFYESSAQANIRPTRRILDRRMSLIWKRRQRRLADRFRRLMVCSEDDRAYLGLDRVCVLPNGFPRIPRVERHPTDPPRLGFLGTFRWFPNVEAMQWFCRTVWPLITRQLPHLSLRIAGVGTEVASGWAPHVEGLGHVVDAGAEMATWAVMIVPIRRGAGTRIKVLEGFARRCPVVATSLGAFGYDLRDGEELFIADAPEVFASRCVDLIRTPLLAHALTDRAHRRFLKCWTWDAHADIVRRAVHDVSASTAHTTHP